MRGVRLEAAPIASDSRESRSAQDDTRVSSGYSVLLNSGVAMLKATTANRER